LNLDRFIARDRARLSRGKATGEAEQLSAKLDDTKIQEEKKKRALAALEARAEELKKQIEQERQEKEQLLNNTK